MQARSRQRKSKFTASVEANLVERLDQKVHQLKVNRSDAVEAAIELWLKKQTEADEEAYCAAASDEMNEDARSWNAITTASLKRNLK